ncbi:hypothetical protein DFS34DRAFT_601941 [Phlyctochytrium arcticum]|nr:hypothetical protein DFS34DRAFT_601941 [Phlyctochytrium arcticum]
MQPTPTDTASLDGFSDDDVSSISTCNPEMDWDFVQPSASPLQEATGAADSVQRRDLDEAVSPGHSTAPSKSNFHTASSTSSTDGPSSAALQDDSQIPTPPDSRDQLPSPPDTLSIDSPDWPAIKKYIDSLNPRPEEREKYMAFASLPLNFQLTALYSKMLDMDRRLTNIISLMNPSPPELNSTLKSHIRKCSMSAVTDPCCLKYEDAVPVIRQALETRGLLPTPHEKYESVLTHEIQRQFTNQKSALKKRMTGVIGNYARSPLPHFAWHIFGLKEVSDVGLEHRRRAALLRWAVNNFGRGDKSFWNKVSTKLVDLNALPDQGAGELDLMVREDELMFAHVDGGEDNQPKRRRARISSEELELARQVMEGISSGDEGGAWSGASVGSDSDEYDLWDFSLDHHARLGVCLDIYYTFSFHFVVFLFCIRFSLSS